MTGQGSDKRVHARWAEFRLRLDTQMEGNTPATWSQFVRGAEVVPSRSSIVCGSHLAHDRWIEFVDQRGKFGLEALVVVVGTLAHDVAHFPIAIGGLAVLTAGLVHDAEAVPAVRLMRISNDQVARCSVGVREFASLDELDHHVGSNRNLIIPMGVPYLCESLGQGVLEGMDIRALGGDVLGFFVGERHVRLCLVVRGSAHLGREGALAGRAGVKGQVTVTTRERR
jgi:hypothetical protein